MSDQRQHFSLNKTFYSSSSSIIYEEIEDRMAKVIVIFLTVSLSGSLGLRPRGVSPDMASFYDPNRSFNCLDGSAEIPFEQINDDYCDCKVGLYLVFDAVKTNDLIFRMEVTSPEPRPAQTDGFIALTGGSVQR